MSPVLEVLPRKGDLGCKMGPVCPCPLFCVLSLTSAWITGSPSLGSGGQSERPTVTAQGVWDWAALEIVLQGVYFLINHACMSVWSLQL